MKRLLAFIMAACILLTLISCGKETQDEQASIYGKWKTERGSLFEFTQEGRYGWYKEKGNISDNYYKGPLELKSGTDALKDLGVSDEEYDRAYKKYTDNKNNIFSLKLHFETLHSEGIDKSSNLNKDDYYYYMFIISSDDPDKGVAINVSEGAPIEVSRVK